MRRHTGWTLAAAGAVMLALAASAGAANEEKAGPPTAGEVTLPWDIFKKVTGFREDMAAANEAGTFTLSWEEVESLLGVKMEAKMPGSKVKIPWQEFKALLEWSIKEQEKGKAPPPPTDWTITSAVYEGDLAKDGAVFTATFKVSILKEKDWKVIPILPATVAVQDITVPKGVHLRLNNNMYEIMTTEKGDMDVVVKFAVAVREQAGSNTLMFARVPSSTCVVKVKVPQKDVDIQVAGAQSTAKKAEGDTSSVVAALPAAAAISLTWERAIQEAEKVPAQLYAETQTLVAVGDGILYGRERINFSILHTGVRVLELSVPQGVSILEVKGERVRDWRTAQDAAKKQDKVVVTLTNDVIGNYALFVTYEKPTQAAAAAPAKAPAAKADAAPPADVLNVPVLRAAGVVRERGNIGLVALANVELSSAKLDGATAIDVRELPPEMLAMTGQPILLAYRYVADTFTIPLAIKKHEDVSVLVTIVDSAVITTMETMEGRRITKAIYNVRNNRQQFLRLALPKGAEIWSATVSGRTVHPGKDEKDRILLPLVRSEGASTGLTAFPVELVYVEKTADGVKIPSSGTVHLELPRASEPITHLMVNLYLPKEGKYTKGWGNAPSIESSLTVVEKFRRLIGAPEAPAVDASVAANAIQQAAQAQVDAVTAASGGTPIRVNLPLDGKQFMLEKVLVLDELLTVDVQYSGWEKK
jgi:hypothetical protein